jgi:hypothetical protein
MLNARLPHHLLGTGPCPKEKSLNNQWTTSTFGHLSGITATSAERPINLSKPKPDWVDIIVVLSPIALMTLSVLSPGPLQAPAREWLSKNWGNTVSAWGLAVSIYVLWVAKGARAAAEEATKETEKAAGEARSSAKVRAALEELQESAESTKQIRLFASHQKWDLVQLRAEEVMNTCRTTVGRWGDDDPLKESQNNLLTVANLMEGIIKEAGKLDVNPAQIEKAQISASKKLSTVLGSVLRGQDSGSK